jgi:hypothetical protein
LDAEQAQPPSGRRAGTRAMAAIAVSAAALALAACSAPASSPGFSPAAASSSGPVRAQDLRAFLTWAITSGIAQLARVNFEPLPPSIITLSTAQIAKIKG